MSEKAKILVQFDTDQTPSLFDRIVAIDSGAEHVCSYGGMRFELVRDLVHGAIFTRGAKQLNHTAIFIGGSDLAAGELLLNEVKKRFLPQYGLRVSVMLDSGGSNTTAAAAVRSARNHVEFASTKALVLGGTGPVGQRVARLLARAGADVRIGSRQKDRAETVCNAIRLAVKGAKVSAVSTTTSADGPAALADVELVIAAGAPGVVLLPKKVRTACAALKVAIDLNAVPPAGIEGVEATDSAVTHDGVVCYGALGVGELKMKLHKAAIAQLFERNDLVLDAEQIYELAE